MNPKVDLILLTKYTYANGKKKPRVPGNSRKQRARGFTGGDLPPMSSVVARIERWEIRL